MVPSWCWESDAWAPSSVPFMPSWAVWAPAGGTVKGPVGRKALGALPGGPTEPSGGGDALRSLPWPRGHHRQHATQGHFTVTSGPPFWTLHQTLTSAVGRCPESPSQLERTGATPRVLQGSAPSSFPGLRAPSSCRTRLRASFGPGQGPACPGLSPPTLRAAVGSSVLRALAGGRDTPGLALHGLSLEDACHFLPAGSGVAGDELGSVGYGMTDSKDPRTGGVTVVLQVSSPQSTWGQAEGSPCLGGNGGFSRAGDLGASRSSRSRLPGTGWCSGCLHSLPDHWEEPQGHRTQHTGYCGCGVRACQIQTPTSLLPGPHFGELRSPTYLNWPPVICGKQ